MRYDTDILIAGGGVAGLLATAAFGQAGFRVTCVDPSPPVTRLEDVGADLRSTAFLQPSVRLLKSAQIWDRLAPWATPLQTMRIIDAGGREPQARATCDFEADEISDQAFGQNLPNWLLRRELVALLAQIETVSFRPGLRLSGLTTTTEAAEASLSDGSKIKAKLVIAADGRDSFARRAMGIDVTTWRYGQKALAFAVTHEKPHGNASTEVHRSGGPFTLVPLPDHNGHPTSAVVWMERGPRASALMALPEAEFETLMTERSSGILGQLRLASRRSIWPIITQFAHHMAGERVALMAEAAHVVPPIGAQGLNMSIADLTVLLALASENPEALGTRDMLECYHQRRHGDIRRRVTGIDLLNRSSMVEAQPLRDLRMNALNLLHGLKPVRHALMKAGLGMR